MKLFSCALVALFATWVNVGHADEGPKVTAEEEASWKKVKMLR